MRKRGISLIILIITIIIILTLVTAIFVNLVNTNLIKRSSESVFKSDIRGFADELSLNLSNEYLKNKGEFDTKKVNSYDNEVWYGDKKQNKTVQDVITNSKNTEYVGKIFIEEGKLVLNGLEITKEEVKWAKEIGILVSFEKGIEELVLISDYTNINVKVPVKNEETIKEYEYTIYEIKEVDGKEEKNEVSTSIKKENETTFRGLAQRKLYEVNVKIRFNNETSVVVERKGRINTKGVEENVTFTQTPEAKNENGEINWTSGNVEVKLSHKDIPEGYEIQYRLTGNMSREWTTGTTVEVTENTTLVIGRLYNKTLDDEVSVNSHQVSNIDKENPSTPTSLNLSKNGNTITATASGSTDGLSGNVTYKYSLDDSSWQDSGTFENLSYGGSYTVYARAVDKVGNVSESVSNSITIDKLSGGVTLSATSGTICVSKTATFTVTNNTSGGTLSVSSSNTSVATVSISGTTVTVTGTSTAGTATITVTSAETSTYNSSSATYAVTVAEHSATTGGSLKSSATCTAPAEYYYKCSRCGIDLPSTYTSGDTLGHNNTSTGNLRSSATCTEAATYWYKCSRCGTQSSSYFSSGSALGHNYVDSTVGDTRISEPGAEEGVLRYKYDNYEGYSSHDMLVAVCYSSPITNAEVWLCDSNFGRVFTMSNTLNYLGFDGAQYHYRIYIPYHTGWAQNVITVRGINNGTFIPVNYGWCAKTMRKRCSRCNDTYIYHVGK